jgi:hypothetical protein
MKRVLALALVFGVAACFGLTGCGEETKTESKDTVSTPGGTTTTTTTEKVNTTGSNPPAPAAK